MSNHRVSIEISSELAADLDALAGSGNRNEFAAKLLEREVRRERLLKALANREPIWKDEDHPELAAGADAWVRGLRQEAEDRFNGL